MSLIRNLKDTLTKNLSNIPGWSTNRKIVIFLVDDWGTIRIPDKEARISLTKEGIDCDSNRFNKYDTLATADDLSCLFEVLSKNKDRDGNSASFNALTVVANPDFEKIQGSGFNQYYYEPFTKTLESYYGDDKVFNLWKQGISDGLFMPQFHGREHLNVDFWLSGLQSGDKNLLAAFDQKAIGVPMSAASPYMSSYMAAFDFKAMADNENLKKVSIDGLKLFQDVFGYQASLFTSSSLLHSNTIEPTLAEAGVKYIDRAKITFEPLGSGKYKRQYYRLGQNNSSDQKYITRNCMFEPNKKPGMDVVNKALKDISIAFRWHKPAIISSHRVNYVGGADVANRDAGLRSLARLLTEIKKQWPATEFMLFDQFAKLL